MIPTPIKATIISEEKPVDVSVAMYEENLAHEKEVAAFGLAAEGKGAVTEVDEHTRIWESFFGPGSCLPADHSAP